MAVTTGSKNPQRMTLGVVTFADEASWKLASIATNQSITHGNVRSWVIRVLNRLPDGPAKDYIKYSFERAGIKHENMAGKGGPGSLGKKTKGKI